jgi:anti-sigma B factor antagonist
VDSSSTLDFAQLEYISSAGLGILLKTQKRLVEKGAGLKIINVNNHIHDVFRYSGFHSIFEIEAG